MVKRSRPSFFMVLAAGCLWAVCVPRGTHASECPNEEESKPLIDFQSKEGPRVFVCGSKKDEEGAMKGILVDGYEIYFQAKGGKPKKILTGSETETHELVHTNANTLVVRRMIWMDQKHQPLLMSMVRCTRRSCEMAPWACALKPPKKLPYPKAVSELQKRLKHGGSDPPYLDNMVAEAGFEAIVGDAKAQEMFQTQPVPKELDGTAAEEWDQAVTTLKELKAAGCPWVK